MLKKKRKRKRKHPAVFTIPVVIYGDHKNSVELKGQQFCNQNKISSYCENKCLRADLIALSTFGPASRMDASTKPSPAQLPCMALKINSLTKHIKHQCMPACASAVEACARLPEATLSPLRVEPEYTMSTSFA